MEGTLFGETYSDTLSSHFFSNTDPQGETSNVLRVAAYCRVSTDMLEQEGSLVNQESHYTQYIRLNQNWKLVKVYSDHGITGTVAKKRTGFTRLMRHAEQGKIDLILCKSVSRFARNVMDTLEQIRMLKENGVRIIFEKEGIDTDSMQSEFIMTMMAAVAQEESHSISQNIQWAIQKRFERGEPQFHRMLGYIEQDDENWVIEEQEASIVKEAFELCLQGVIPPEIGRIFIRKGYQTVRGKIEWSGCAVRTILGNSAYAGDLLCGKTYTADYLTHKVHRNKGGKAQYLIEGHHKAIIERKTFDKVQEQLAIRTRHGKGGNRKTYPFSGRLVCGVCSSNLQRFVSRESVTWRCGKHNKSASLCEMRGAREEDVLKAAQLVLEAKYKGGTLNAALLHNTVSRMLRDLNSVETTNDIEHNRPQLELERILYEENMALLAGLAKKEKV